MISEGKHQLRIDEEDTKPLQIEDEFLQNVLEIIDRCEVLILQDYNKGVLTKKIISELISEENKRGIPIIVDPKKDNFLEYKNCDIFKPNLKEIKEGMKIDFNEKIDSELENVTFKLKEELNAKGILLTLSSDGICINSDEGFVHSQIWWSCCRCFRQEIPLFLLLLSYYLKEYLMKIFQRFPVFLEELFAKKVGVVPINKEELLSEKLQII